MTLPQIRRVLDESRKIDSVEWIYFEGGEPFLFYPSLLEGMRHARDLGFKVGIVTNAYGAVSEEDAQVWLRPLADIGVACLSISDDSFHYGQGTGPAKYALEAARKLGIRASPICIQRPFVEAMPGQGQDRGGPVVGGGAMFRGRAVEKLTEGLPCRPCHEFEQCPYENLQSPARVHVDSYGHVHLCQGLSMGNMQARPLSAMVIEYDADSHPICGPLSKGGPALLARRYDVQIEKDCVDECHFCYLVRRSLVDRFPEYLGPRQVYGLEEN